MSRRRPQPGKIQRQPVELLRQRVFGLACGYADCNDAARLADDVIHKPLEMDRTSCSRFWANQFRVLLALTAYILFQETPAAGGRRRVRRRPGDDVARELGKLAVWVERSARRIVLHLPMTFPWLSTWRQLALAVGATA